MDYKLEMVQFPVTDVDRAKTFYLDQMGCGLVVDREVPEGKRSSTCFRPARPARSALATVSPTPLPELHRGCSSWPTFGLPATS
jgi:catechol 2,3-dioxygenase-like lactoylglutathione lyase family enzyme